MKQSDLMCGHGHTRTTSNTRYRTQSKLRKDGTLYQQISRFCIDCTKEQGQRDKESRRIARIERGVLTEDGDRYCKRGHLVAGDNVVHRKTKSVLKHREVATYNVKICRECFLAARRRSRRKQQYQVLLGRR